MEEQQAVEVLAMPADAITAEELCPLLWSLVEDTAAQGYISPGQWKEHLLHCDSCQMKLLDLMKQATEEMDLDPATRLFMRTLWKKARQLMLQVNVTRAALAASQKQLTEGQTQ